MSVKIRLSRKGSKKRPFYHIVVANSRAPRDGNFIEKVGTYNPMVPSTDTNRLTLLTDRIKHWLDQGAQPTDKVARFLSAAGLTKSKYKVAEQTKQHLPKAKAQAKLKEMEEKRLAEIEAKKQAEEEARAAFEAEQAPKEEVAAETPAEEVQAEASAEETPAS